MKTRSRYLAWPLRARRRAGRERAGVPVAAATARGREAADERRRAEREGAVTAGTSVGLGDAGLCSAGCQAASANFGVKSCFYHTGFLGENGRGGGAQSFIRTACPRSWPRLGGEKGGQKCTRPSHSRVPGITEQRRRGWGHRGRHSRNSVLPPCRPRRRARSPHRFHHRRRQRLRPGQTTARRRSRS